MSLLSTPARDHMSSSSRSWRGRGMVSGNRSEYSASTERMMPTWYGAPAALDASTSALTTSSDAMAGYSGGTYPLGVPSLRTAPMPMTRSPILISGWAAPHVPTRRNVCTPSSLSSSTAIATEGPPMPDEIVETGTPSRLPVNVRYSRLKATSRASSRYLAIAGVRPGSPGTSTYPPTSPFARPMWYFFSSVAAIAAKFRGLPVLGPTTLDLVPSVGGAGSLHPRRLDQHRRLQRLFGVPLPSRFGDRLAGNRHCGPQAGGHRLVGADHP